MPRERKGGVVERDGKIYARIRFKDDSGKNRDFWRKVESRKHARSVIRQMLKEVEDSNAKRLDSANLTFAELAHYYIKNYLHEAVYVGEMKVSGVRGVIEALSEVKPLQEYFGKRKIRSITYGDIRTYKQTRLQTPKRSDIAYHQRELQTNPKAKLRSTRTITAVNKELGKLRRMFNIAVREQWLTRNPFNNGESLISVETHRLRILSRDEETRLFAAIDAEPKRAHIKGICLLALDCALRRGEIFTLRWSDVDLDQRIVTVRAFNSKTARSRTVALTIRAYQELERLWQESELDSNARVFGVSVTIKTAWKKICRDAGIKDFHFHDCRATAISRMISAGRPPAEVMRVSGHTTLRAFYIYVRSDLDTAFRAASALDTLLAQNTRIEASQAIN